MCILITELKQDINSGISDPLVDITSFEDTSLADGYGITPEKPSGTGGNIVHQSMIKRSNISICAHLILSS